MLLKNHTVVRAALLAVVASASDAKASAGATAKAGSLTPDQAKKQACDTICTSKYCSKSEANWEHCFKECRGQMSADHPCFKAAHKKHFTDDDGEQVHAITGKYPIYD